MAKAIVMANKTYKYEQIHHASCEGAESVTCECRCLGMLHQKNILDLVFAGGKDKGLVKARLHEIYGSSFQDF